MSYARDTQAHAQFRCTQVGCIQLLQLPPSRHMRTQSFVSRRCLSWIFQWSGGVLCTIRSPAFRRTYATKIYIVNPGRVYGLCELRCAGTVRYGCDPLSPLWKAYNIWPRTHTKVNKLVHWICFLIRTNRDGITVDSSPLSQTLKIRVGCVVTIMDRANKKYAWNKIQSHAYNCDIHMCDLCVNMIYVHTRNKMRVAGSLSGSECFVARVNGFVSTCNVGFPSHFSVMVSGRRKLEIR